MARRTLRSTPATILSLCLLAALAALGCSCEGCDCGQDKKPDWQRQREMLTYSPTPSPSPSATGGRDISTPSAALLGHWKQKKGVELWFSPSGVVMRTPCGEKFKGTYKVLSEDVAKRKGVVQAKFPRIGKLKGQYRFTNAACTKMSLDWAGSKLKYVDDKQKP